MCHTRHMSVRHVSPYPTSLEVTCRHQPAWACVQGNEIQKHDTCILYKPEVYICYFLVVVLVHASLPTSLGRVHQHYGIQTRGAASHSRQFHTQPTHTPTKFWLLGKPKVPPLFGGPPFPCTPGTISASKIQIGTSKKGLVTSNLQFCKALHRDLPSHISHF